MAKLHGVTRGHGITRTQWGHSETRSHEETHEDAVSREDTVSMGDTVQGLGVKRGQGRHIVIMDRRHRVNATFSTVEVRKSQESFLNCVGPFYVLERDIHQGWATSLKLQRNFLSISGSRIFREFEVTIPVHFV